MKNTTIIKNINEKARKYGETVDSLDFETEIHDQSLVVLPP